MRKEETICICERCGLEKRVKAYKLGPLHKSGFYPKDWRKIWKGTRVCHTCAKDFDETWNHYLQLKPKRLPS